MSLRKLELEISKLTERLAERDAEIQTLKRKVFKLENPAPKVEVKPPQKLATMAFTVDKEDEG